MKKVTIYTDGACRGNPGPGGWCAILKYNGSQKILSGGEAETTNNRMELLGVINGLKALKEPCEVELFTDSAYVINAFKQGWIHNWKINGWMRKEKKQFKELKNKELWQQLDHLASQHKINWQKVAGHSGIELNEMADQIAGKEADKFTNHDTE